MERFKAGRGFLKKIQLPVIGGIRKVITPGSNVPVGTTIAEVGSGTISLAQLTQIISQIQAQQTNTGGGNIGKGDEGTLIPGPGLAGGGPLVGNVPIRLIAPIPWFDDAGGGGDGDPGPPGQAGRAGTNGATGGVGPMGPAIFMAADAGQDGDSGPTGTAGAAGATGPAGPTGPAGTTLVYVNATVPAGNTVANTSSETFFTSSYTVPANSLAIGTVLRLKLFGVYSTGVVAPSLILKVYFGATVLIASGTLTTVAAVTNDGWSAEGLFTVQTIGVSGTMEAQGLSEFSTASTAVLFVNMDNTAPITVDTTINETVRASVQWGGTVNASDTITLREMTLEVMSVAGIPAVTPASPVPFTVFFGEDGEDGFIGPPGPQGPAGAGGGGGGGNPYSISPLTHLTGVPAFVADDDFEQTNGTAVDTAGTRFTGATAWTWLNRGAATAIQQNGSLVLTPDPATARTNNLIQPVNGGTWAVQCCVSMYNQNSDYGGLIVYESVSGKSTVFAVYAGTGFLRQDQPTLSTSGGTSTGGTWLQIANDTFPCYLQIVFDGTTLFYNASMTGIPGTFRQQFTQTAASFLGVAPTHYGIFCNNASAAKAVFDQFRQTA